jgi:hypothetical protein
VQILWSGFSPLGDGEKDISTFAVGHRTRPNSCVPFGQTMMWSAIPRVRQSVCHRPCIFRNDPGARLPLRFMGLSSLSAIAECCSDLFR